ncbi:MAG TPA: hypothetical protein VHU81_09845 [Thermoanaerobaculia bacterium]|nr:hypothetical protein [Thermoanaerobaculia bacterium]
MKKEQKNERILGRRLAIEADREELKKATGAINTWTLTDPADRDRG